MFKWLKRKYYERKLEETRDKLSFALIRESYLDRVKVTNYYLLDEITTLKFNIGIYRNNILVYSMRLEEMK